MFFNRNRKPLSKKGKTITAIAAGALLLIGGFLVWADYSGSSPTTVAFPKDIETNQDIWLGLMAGGQHTALQYFPGGYAVYPKAYKDPSTGKSIRAIRSFEIQSPGVQDSEAFAGPASNYDIVYQFSWKEPDSNGNPGRSIKSEIRGSSFPGQIGWVNVLPNVLANAKDVTQIANYSLAPAASVDAIRLSLLPSQSVLIRTFWADDSDRNGGSGYTDIQKLFAGGDSHYVDRDFHGL